MAYASVTYTSASGTTFALTNSNGDPIPYIRQSDIKVYVNTVLQTLTTDYTFNTAGTAIVLNSAVSGATVLLQRITDITDPTVVYTAGSTLTAQDLNNADNQIRYGLQEFQDSVQAGAGVPDGDKGDIVVGGTGTIWTVDTGAVTEGKIASGAVTETKIGTGAVTSTKIANDTIVDADINSAAAISLSKLATGALPTAITVASANIVDGTIVDADISASAEIAVSKLANGTARQLIQTDAAGTGVEWTSNVDVPGTLDVTGAATFDSTVTATGNVTVPSLNGGPLAGARNILINGDTRIDQRNGGAAVTLNNSATYPCDRWITTASGGLGTGTATVQRVVDAPAGLTTSLKWTTTNAKTPAAADAFYVWQAIEGHNIDHIGFNTASAKPLTLSFWVKSSLTGTFSGFCRQQSSAPAYRSYVFTYTISSANAWEYKTVSISADPSSGFAPNLDGNSGLGILFDMGSGSTYETGTTGAWQSGNYFRSTGSVRIISTLNATWQVTGVQLEAGTVATPFERRGYGQELMLCQRYFASLDNGSTLPVTTNVGAERGFFKLPVQMRAVPNCTFVYDGGGTGATWALGLNGGYQATNHSGTTGFSVLASAELG